MPIKTFAPGVLTSSDVNTYLMRQAVITCTSTTRPSAPVDGMTIFETNTEFFRVWDGSAWQVVVETGTWDNYTPTILSTGAGTDWALGNATVTGQYVRIGRFVAGNAQIVFGNTSVFGTKALLLSVPLDMRTVTTTNAVMGIARYNDTSAGSPYVGGLGYHSATYVALFAHSVSATFGLFDGVVATTPFTWANTDTISVNFYYETTVA